MVMLVMPLIHVLFDNANNLEMFSIKFGASLVFKISSNFAFKNNLEK
jgi:hypothetical protein